MGNLSSLTGRDTYFEDFEVGTVIRHARGKTVTQLENVLITNLVMNTSQAHFNEHAMQDYPGGAILVYGGVSLSIVLGLASQDTIENALAELGLDDIKLMRSVAHGDTLYAFSEIVAKQPGSRDDAGEVTFRHFGVNQRDEQVVQVDRRALVKRRSHWASR